MDMIVRGNELRTISPTAANATSSRSHAVLQINVSQKDRNADIHEPHTMATLSIIDLAGSERASATLNRGERLLEGANINKSLLALGGCINALCDPRKRNHVPYRNSKLTRLLKFSLGGNCKTVMIVCVSPSSAHFDETQNTLRYANRAKNIQTKVTRNVYNVNRHVKDFLKKIDEQMALINELKQQQKEHEANAFVKFRKVAEKKDIIARDGIARIRKAYEDSNQERQERINLMKKCRQIERRLSLISTWVAGFDTICDAREEEDPPNNLVAMRKTAQGILAELESSRQHCHQRIAKNNWDRALETSLQTGVRQLRETDGSSEPSEISSLVREAELLRSMADREAYMSVLEQEKGGDASIVQVLLQAHFDTIAILGQIMQMSEEEAVQAARKLLGKIIMTCTAATSQVIKPDGGLPVTEKFAPSKIGTPKFRRTANLMGPSPIPKFEMNIPLSAAFEPVMPSPYKASPIKSPRRRKGIMKKVGMTTPSRRSPIKMKGGIRWRDAEDSGTLVEFQPTPQMTYSTPEISSEEPPPPQFTLPMNPMLLKDNDSSPITTPPEMSQEVKPRISRFQVGHLSKKSDGSPIGPPPTSSVLNSGDWSDSDTTSPLREIQPNKMPHMSPLQKITNASSDVTPGDSGNSSSEEDFKKPPRPSSATKPAKNTWPGNLDRSEAKQIRSALKRTSSIGSNSGNSANATRTQRRRSPTASSAGSPTSSQVPQFSSSQARRMGTTNSFLDRERSGLNGVLSPRTASVIKGGAMRRTTVADDLSHAVPPARSGPVRLSSAVIGATTVSRGSLAPGSKNVWR
jgi:kinesin family protein 18/19